MRLLTAALDVRGETHPNWSAQDTLYFDVTYDAVSVGLQSIGKSASPEAAVGLADALATFLQWYNASAGSIDIVVQAALPSATGTSTTSRDEAKALISTFVELADRVADAWAAVSSSTLEYDAPSPMTQDTFQIKTDPTDPKRRVLLGYTAATPNNPLFWPTINGTAHRAADAQPLANGWWLQPQPFATTEAVDVAIPDLQITHHQSARLSAWIVRNGDLVPTAATNPAFVRTTSVISFSDEVIPLIRHPAVATLEPASSLTATLEAILRPIASTGIGPATRLRVGVSYSFTATRVESQRIRQTEAVVLMNDVTVGPKEDVQAIAASLAKGISEWYQAAMRSSDDARLGIALMLFGAFGAQVLPLAQIDDIPIDVSRVGTPAVKWWTA